MPTATSAPGPRRKGADVSGAAWNVFGRVGASWARLGASWGVLERLGRVLKRKKSERGPGPQLRLAAGNPPRIKDEELYCRKTTLQTSTDHLPTHPDTQLGAFGPGADIQSAAELRARHRAKNACN